MSSSLRDQFHSETRRIVPW